MDRDQALRLMTEWTPSESLQRHMLCVEACLRGYAAARGEDVELWGRAGLLHDFDYERHPDDHPLPGLALLEALGEDPALIQAVAAHYEAKTGVAPTSDLDKHLFACDELSGFVVACVYVRPSKSVLDLEVKSVRKKLKTPAFAAAVSRDDIEQGAAMIGLDLDEHIGNVIRFLQAEADALGLAGGTP